MRVGKYELRKTGTSIFLKAADLVAGPFRAKMNAATMLAQRPKCLSKPED